VTRLLKFGIVGVIAFGVDAALLYVGHYILGIDPYLARIFSFVGAFLCNWLLSRRWVFGQPGSPNFREMFRYLGVQAIGNAVSYGVYAIGLWLGPALGPMIWLVIAAAAAAGVNFFGATAFAFRGDSR
jgi:putative flippase GtrA